MIEITDITAPELAPYAKLTEAQLRSRIDPESALIIVESPKVIHTALDAGLRPVSLLMERRHITGDGAGVIARCGDVPLYTGDREVLRSLTGYALTRGVLCAMARPGLPAPDELLRVSRRVAVMEGVVDSTNIGAVFRSAAALGMDALLLSPTCCDPFNRRSIRVSMGAVFQVPWTYLEGWPERGFALLRERGFKTAALALTDRSLPIDHPAPKGEPRLAMLLGSEGTGLEDGTVALCDYTLKIPMAHGVDSLNVSAAAAVAFWELRVREGSSLSL